MTKQVTSSRTTDHALSRTQRFLSGLRLGYAYQALVTLTGLWLTPFLLQRVGQHDYGLWLVGAQMMSFLMLADCGLIALLPRETAYATGRAGSSAAARELPQLLGMTMRLMLWQTPAVLLGAVALWYWLPLEWAALERPLALALLIFVAIFPLRPLHAMLQGLQDLAFLGRVQLAVWLLATALTVGLVWAGWGSAALALGWAVTQALPVACYWLRLRRRFPHVWPAHWPALTGAAARDQLQRSLWVQALQVAQTLLHGSDLIIIGYLLGPSAVVLYACSSRLISVLYNQPQALMVMAGPGLSEMKMGAAQPRLFQVTTALMQAILWASGAVICVVLVVNRGFVGWWVGAEQYGGVWLNVLLLANMLLRHWNVVALCTVFCIGGERQAAVTMLLDGLLSVGAAVSGVWLLGPIGAPLGSLLGVCAISLPRNLAALARESGRSVAALSAPLWPWCWRFCWLAALAGALASVWTPSAWPALVAATLLTSLIYLAVTLPTVLKSTLGPYLRPRLAPLRAKLFGAPTSI